MHPVKKIDRGSLVVMVVTFFLFVGAVFSKGLTHDLLLEAGIFLVSAKLIIMAYHNRVRSDMIIARLEEIKALEVARCTDTPPERPAGDR
jgi:hypothetical protein